MATEQEIKEKVLELNFLSRLFARFEISEIKNVVGVDESIVMIAQGKYHNEGVIVIATDLRVILLNKRFLTGMKVEDFNYADIESIEYFVGPFFGSISIVTEGKETEIRRIFAKSAKKFAETLRSMVTAAKKAEAVTLSMKIDDNISKLERLQKLKNDGILTPEEFDKEKHNILNLN